MADAGQAPAARILVVDDDPHLRDLVGGVMQSSGYEPLYAEDGDAVVEAVRRWAPQLVLLDLRMPRVSGLEALRALRAAGLKVAVIVLTGANDEEVLVAALQAGADDYVTKPFSVRVLLARIQAVLRRSSGEVAEQPECVGPVCLDPRTHEVWVDERAVQLTPTEFELLRTLMSAPGRAFTPTELLERVWGPGYIGQDEIVRANIYRLRQKVEPDPQQPRYLLSRRGVGYYLAVREQP